MKNYIKPTFTLAGLTPVALSTGGCNIPKDELEILAGIIGTDPTNKAVFTTAEIECKEQYELDIYCKYTAGESGAPMIVLGS